MHCLFLARSVHLEAALMLRNNNASDSFTDLLKMTVHCVVSQNHAYKTSSTSLFSDRLYTQCAMLSCLWHAYCQVFMIEFIGWKHMRSPEPLQKAPLLSQIDHYIKVYIVNNPTRSLYYKLMLLNNWLSNKFCLNNALNLTFLSKVFGHINEESLPNYTLFASESAV